MTSSTDVLVLGAGMVGISAALHLQAHGRAVVLADRRGAAEETSHGNAGLIQREAVVPHAFPRDLRRILRAALGRSTEAHIHLRALPELAPFLIDYWRHGTPERIARSAIAARPLVERSVDEHEALMAAACAQHLMQRNGYIKLYRSQRAFDAELAAHDSARTRYGISAEARTDAQLHALEPHLMGRFAGGIHMTQPLSVSDPGALGKAYAALFVARGGRFVSADANTLEETADGWLLRRAEGDITAGAVVVALGPWSRQLLRGLGVKVPMGVKRGYHMHYAPAGNAVLTRPVLDAENGYAMAGLSRGIRITTGAEFAPHLAPATPHQLDMAEPRARQLFPLAGRLDAKPWLGARPCFADMLPMIGEVPGRPGLWLDTGHHHLGFTLGPVTGRLLAELMTGAQPFTDPRPYRVDRFG